MPSSTFPSAKSIAADTASKAKNIRYGFEYGNGAKLFWVDAKQLGIDKLVVAFIELVCAS
jgi:hypothetical protein